MNTSKQSEIKLLMEKLNLLFRIFEKEGFDKISNLEKELLKEQVNNLLKAIDSLEVVKVSVEKEEVVHPINEAQFQKPKVTEPVEVIPPVKEPKEKIDSLSINEQAAQKIEERAMPQRNPIRVPFQQET